MGASSLIYSFSFPVVTTSGSVFPEDTGIFSLPSKVFRVLVTSPIAIPLAIFLIFNYATKPSLHYSTIPSIDRTTTSHYRKRLCSQYTQYLR